MKEKIILLVSGIVIIIFLLILMIYFFKKSSQNSNDDGGDSGGGDLTPTFTSPTLPPKPTGITVKIQKDPPDDIKEPVKLNVGAFNTINIFPNNNSIPFSISTFNSDNAPYYKLYLKEITSTSAEGIQHFFVYFIGPNTTEEQYYTININSWTYDDEQGKRVLYSNITNITLSNTFSSINNAYTLCIFLKISENDKRNYCLGCLTEDPEDTDYINHPCLLDSPDNKTLSGATTYRLFYAFDDTNFGYQVLAGQT